MTPVESRTATPAAIRTMPPSSEGLLFDNFDMFDQQRGWAWAGVSQLYRTDDGGTTWAEIHLQGKRQVPGAAFLNGDEAWLLGIPDGDLKQAVFRTSDGGQTWTQLGAVPGPNAALFFHDSQRGWALNGIGAAGSVLYEGLQTMDGGQTWAQLWPTTPGAEQVGQMPNTIRVAAGDTVTFEAPNTIWTSSGHGAATPYAGLAVSRDAGNTWHSINPSLPASYLLGEPAVTVAAPQFVTERDGYLPVTVGERLVFFASHDSGLSWVLLPGILPSDEMHPRVQFVGLDVGFAACGPNLCVSGDGAKTWEVIPTPFAFSKSASGSHVSEFDFVDPVRGWAILTDPAGKGTFVETMDGGRTWIDIRPKMGF